MQECGTRTRAAAHGPPDRSTRPPTTLAPGDAGGALPRAAARGPGRRVGARPGQRWAAAAAAHWGTGRGLSPLPGRAQRRHGVSGPPAGITRRPVDSRSPLTPLTPFGSSVPPNRTIAAQQPQNYIPYLPSQAVAHGSTQGEEQRPPPVMLAAASRPVTSPPAALDRFLGPQTMARDTPHPALHTLMVGDQGDDGHAVPAPPPYCLSYW